MIRLLLIFALVPTLLFSQTRKQRKALEAQRKADEKVINNLKNHFDFFANNIQNSKAVVKEGEAPVEYISNQFKSIGLQPKGTNGYIQQFKVDEGKQIAPVTSLKLNGTLLAVKRDYFPLPFSATKSVTGMPAIALKEKGVPWFTDIKDWLDDNDKNADFDILKAAQKEAVRAASKGATALFLYNSSNLADNIRFNSRDKTSPLSIPVIYITPKGYSKYLTDQSQVLDIELNVAFKESIKNASNVVGYIDKGASTNIVIATPYKPTYHEESDSLADNEKVKEYADIASGTSMLIELARMLSASKAKNSNYTFIAYTSEDSLSQTCKWLNNSAITLPVNYVVNLQKVGRYDQDKKLLIEGYGTTPDWVQAIKPLADKNVEVTFDSTGHQLLDSSIHMAVPVLNFFTVSPQKDNYSLVGNGTINYEGELQIAKFIYHLVEATDGKGKVALAEKNITEMGR
ncbi:hypothetical protein [Segetibacter koreensis]|uniref:hypothetical protein n=1 Tax=Segetibacter koreensis TaxID=398037 RepID=UPI0003650686|nr:hypothetical protein [Segetibacter koreensis]